MDVVIETRQRVKEFGHPEATDAKGRPTGVRAVAGIDPQANPGAIFGLLGPHAIADSVDLSVLVGCGALALVAGTWAFRGMA